ncbi:MAG: hypothetical protein AAGK04_11400 [Planctomycetota bacterium]
MSRTCHRTWFGWVALLFAGVGLPADRCCAQVTSSLANDTPTTGEVAVDLAAFGFGGSRAGEWTGLRLTILDRGERQRTLLVRWHGWDRDGDTPFYERAIASNPGQALSVWVYGRLPYDFNEDTPIEVTVHEGLDDASAADGTGYRAGRVVGRLLTSLSASGGRVGRLTPIQQRRYAVVGSSRAGLDGYAARAPNQSIGTPWAPLGHELTSIAAGLTPQQFPDRWMGLASLDVIVWERGNPADLSGARARALRRWIERGGRLVVVLPSAGQEWGQSVNNPLRDILPRVATRRMEGVSLEAFRGLLVPRAGAGDPIRLPSRSVVHAFDPLADAEPSEAVPLLKGENGDIVVVQRLLGVGDVTLIGLNLRAPSLASVGLPSTVSFWNRVLGRRGRFLSVDELASIDDRSTQQLMAGARTEVFYDIGMGDLVSKTGRAAAGLLAGVGLGVAYVAIAGPIGFALLRRFDRTRHAWLAFVIAAAGFTGAAWGTAAALRPKSVEGRHLTFLDHVYGQPLQRGRTWMGLLLPGYGEEAIRVGDPELSRTRGGDRAGAWDVIAPWEPLATSAQGGFPDARGYAIWAAAPDSMTPPTRATVKRVQVDWAGGPRWSMPRPAQEGSIRLRDRTAWNLEGMLTGSLTHGLPAPMTDVSVIVIAGQRTVGRLGGAEIVSDARAFSLSEWEPGAALDLPEATKGTSNVQSLLRSFMDGLTDRPRGGFAVGVTDRTLENTRGRLTALALFGQLTPPEPTGGASESIVALRRATHGWDLDRWMTRPCLIIIGRVESEGEDACPTPVHVGDASEPVSSEGLTIVRWVYPLEPAPPGYPVSSLLPSGADDAEMRSDREPGL